MNDDDALIESFREQVRWCDKLGSPFTARLLESLADDWLAGGPMRTLLPAWTAGPPGADLMPLRLAGALHALALSGAQPALAALYPPAATGFDAAALMPLLRRLLADEAGYLREYLKSAPQTNEVSRSAVLLPGYAAIARATGLPLALREIGASAGLNLLWDRFGYRFGDRRWGDAASPVQLSTEWRGPPPDLPERIEVAERRGNDLAPIDVSRPEAALRLRAYVWADQAARAARLRAAIALAQQHPPALEAGDAADWVEHTLAEHHRGRALVVVHSVVWQYLPAATQQRIEAALHAAGTRADTQSPLAWLRMEFFERGAPAELRLRLWPDGSERVLARAHPHGEWVEWLDAPALSAS